MTDLSIRQGETLEFNVQNDDLSAETIVLTVRNDDEGIVIQETATFSTVDGKRVAVITTNDTVIPLGDYEYMFKVTYSDGSIDKMPDTDCDAEDCSFPTITICEALDLEVS
jgi:hypothetical protein